MTRNQVLLLPPLEAPAIPRVAGALSLFVPKVANMVTVEGQEEGQARICGVVNLTLQGSTTTGEAEVTAGPEDLLEGLGVDDDRLPSPRPPPFRLRNLPVGVL